MDFRMIQAWKNGALVNNPGAQAGADGPGFISIQGGKSWNHLEGTF
jgi:hypothetical protein